MEHIKFLICIGIFGFVAMLSLVEYVTFLLMAFLKKDKLFGVDAQLVRNRTGVSRFIFLPTKEQVIVSLIITLILLSIMGVQ